MPLRSIFGDLPSPVSPLSEPGPASAAPVRARFSIEPRHLDGAARLAANEKKSQEARGEAIEVGLARQYMGEALGRHAVGLVMACTMAAVCWPYVHPAFVVLWLGMVLAGTFARRRFARHFQSVVDSAGPQARNAFLQRLVPFYAVMGLTWGMSLPMFAGSAEGARGFACWAILAALVYGANHRLALLPQLWRAFMHTFFIAAFCYFAYRALAPGAEASVSLWFLPLCLAQFWFTRRLSVAVLHIQSALYGAQYDLARKSDEALAAVVAKNKFLAAATHDMRQPVIAMGLYAEFLEAEPQSYNELAPKIGRAAQVVNRLFDSLFDLSAFDAGQVRLAVQSVSVGAVILALQEEYEPLAAARGLTLRVRVHDAVVQSDEVRLRRMIGNVLSNAIKYSKPGGKVLLAMRPAGGTVRVEIWDQGIGIPAAQIDKVFQEFFRADGGSQLAPDGLGIGLALVARLADALRTRILIDSVEGQGTRVSLTLGSVEADASKQVQLSAACG
ncbi:sensor histidine kinase [Variovorax sp. ZT4R33]|uniref:sensor histidine kinase n=1 Tax=Variovorax sp. ZT4R33 TaxID=3443743 RepID=UPI003F455558